MKNLGIAPALLTLLLMGSRGAAQTGDWQVVESLPQRILISVEDYGAVGAILGSAHGHFSHGTIIYRNPDEKTKTAAPTLADYAESQDLKTQDLKTLDLKTMDEISAADRVDAARSPYTQPEDGSDASNARVTLAQFPRRRPGPPFSRGAVYPRSPYPGSTYPRMWTGTGSGRHAAIGALIGFGIGAALGAKANKDPTPGATLKASMLVGSVVGVLGALIGQGPPSYARLQRPRERRTDKRWSDQDEMASSPNQTDTDTSKRTCAREGAPELSRAARPTNSEPASAESPATP